METNCQAQQWGISCQFWLNKQRLFNSKCILNKLANIMHDSGRWKGRCIAWSSALNLNLEKSTLLPLHTSKHVFFFSVSMQMWIISSQILHTVHGLHKTTNFPLALFAVKTEYIGKLRLFKSFLVIKCVYE